MSKKHFIKLADAIREENMHGHAFSEAQIECLAEFCRQQNYNFKRDRWIAYINGECGSNGGAIRKAA